MATKLLTKEEIILVEIPVGEKNKVVSFAPVSGRVIGLVVYHNKERLQANLSLKEDTGGYISKPQHIDNYRSRNSCYFTGCKPVDFNPQNKTHYVEVSCEDNVTDVALKVQLILIYEDTRFDTNCQ